MSDYVLFVDTNIFLDFYRVRQEVGLKLLEALDGAHDKLLTTYQVEMEFKKNRQRAILETLGSLKARDRVPHAAFLAKTKSAEQLDSVVKDMNSRIGKFRDRLVKVLENPTSHDPVYQLVQRLFADDTPLNLNRKKKARHGIKRLAFRRFILGYPPRKRDDTSMGDALNWEWIVKAAKDSGKHVVVVSRDSDFGTTLKGRSYINDWLAQEFRERVSNTRQIVLHSLLAPALKLIKVKVTRQVEAAEEEIARISRARSAWPWSEVSRRGWARRHGKLIEGLEDRVSDNAADFLREWARLSSEHEESAD